MRNYHLDLVRVTEAGAISAATWVGRGNKESADKAATDAMRDRLNKIDFLAEISIGEGIKDKSFGLFEGEYVGLHNKVLHTTTLEKPFRIHPNSMPNYSIAVDPIEGTSPTANGGNEAMSVLALGNYGCFYKTTHFYMKKLAVGPKVAQKVKLDIRQSIYNTIIQIAAVLNKPLEHLTICVLERKRHDALVAKLREIGCRIKFITDCDVTACIATCVPNSGIDAYFGVGGSPEAMITAAAMKCMGGQFQAMLADSSGQIIDEKLFEIEDLAAGDVTFCATGITDGQLLRGVQFTENGTITHSITMRSESKTIRRMTTEHGN